MAKIAERRQTLDSSEEKRVIDLRSRLGDQQAKHERLVWKANDLLLDARLRKRPKSDRPYLATAWYPDENPETVGLPEGTTVSFRLEGAKTHDGSTVRMRLETDEGGNLAFLIDNDVRHKATHKLDDQELVSATSVVEAPGDGSFPKELVAMNPDGDSFALVQRAVEVIGQGRDDARRRVLRALATGTGEDLLM